MCESGVSHQTSTYLDWLAEVCQGNLIDEKWLLVEDFRIGHSIKDQLNLAGVPTLNLHAKTLHSIAKQILGDQIVEHGLHVADPLACDSLMRGILIEAGLGEDTDVVTSNETRGSLRYFLNCSNSSSLSSLLVTSIRDLKFARISPDEIQDTQFESVEKAHDVRLLYSLFESKLSEINALDSAGIFQQAIECLQEKSYKFVGNAKLLRSVELEPTHVFASKLEQEFLQELENHCELVLHGSTKRRRINSGEIQEQLRQRVADKEISLCFFAAMGSSNEVRAVVQRSIQSTNKALSVREASLNEDEKESLESAGLFENVEIACADYRNFVGPVLEQFSRWSAENQSSDKGRLPDFDQLPLTFADGIPAIFTRPGRALRLWTRWSQQEYFQPTVVQLVREGLLNRPIDERDEALVIGYSRLASTLGSLPIGKGVERYEPALLRAQEEASKRKIDFEAERGEPRDANTNEQFFKSVKGRRDTNNTNLHSDFGLACLQMLQDMILPVLELAPKKDEDPIESLKRAKRFLISFARCESKLDRLARNQLLDSIDAAIQTLSIQSKQVAKLFDGCQWLEELPESASLMKSGPVPGRIHVSPLKKSGFTGRCRVFFTGLEKDWLSTFLDPILLDSERTAISEDLVLSSDHVERQRGQLYSAIQRVIDQPSAELNFSYSQRDLSQDKATYPAAELLEIFRCSSAKEEISIQDFTDSVEPATSFLGEEQGPALTESEMALMAMLSTEAGDQISAHLPKQFSHLRERKNALEKIAGGEFTEFHGYVPQAGTHLNPIGTNRPLSASQLEAYGTCPRRYFFAMGLMSRAWIYGSHT